MLVRGLGDKSEDATSLGHVVCGSDSPIFGSGSVIPNCGKFEKHIPLFRLALTQLQVISSRPSQPPIGSPCALQAPAPDLVQVSGHSTHATASQTVLPCATTATPDDPYGTLSWRSCFRFSGPNRTFPAGCRKDRSRTPCLIGRFPHKDGGSLANRGSSCPLHCTEHGTTNDDNNKNENNEPKARCDNKDGTHAETRTLGLGTTNCIYHLTPMPTTAFGTCDLTVAFFFSRAFGEVSSPQTAEHLALSHPTK